VGYCLFARIVAFYLSVDVFGTLMYAPILYGMYAIAVRSTAADQKQAKLEHGRDIWPGTGRLLITAFWLHVLAWYVQIHPGHRVIEGAQPALMQGLGGALSSAPLFAFYEGLWFFGIRQGFHAQVEELVMEYPKKLCEEGVIMRACASLA
jgi:uncharacterized membrane protein YGL010W